MPQNGSRRAFLGALGVGATGLLAGCLGELSAALFPHRHVRDAVLGPTEGWPAVCGGPRNRSANLDGEPVPEDPRLRELGRMDSYRAYAPSVGNGTVVFGEYHATWTDRGKSFRTVARDGDEMVWTADRSVHTTPTVVGDAVICSGDQTYALDRRTGDLCWRYSAGKPDDWLGPAVADETVYVPGLGRIVALDAVTGELVWETDAPAGRDLFLQGIAAGEDRVFVTNGNGEAGLVTAFDRASGGHAWSYEVHRASYAPPVVGDRHVFVVETSGFLHALTFDGETAWTADLGGESYVPPAYADGTVYVSGTNDSVLRALDAETGEQVWRHEEKRCYAHPTVVVDVVYTAFPPTALPSGWTHTIHAIDRETGDHRRSHELPASIDTPLSVADGRAYFAGNPETVENSSAGRAFELG